jgi:hypothetical protein
MIASGKFFAGLALGLVMALVLNLAAFGLVLGVPTESSRWTFEINRRKQELARATSPPRLLLVGGSGLLFGVSAREIERQTGCRTLNLGTHVALGTPYILAKARNVAQPGDTILLILEYELYVSSGAIKRTGADSVWLDYLVARDPAYFHQAPLSEQWNIFMLTPIARLKIALKNLLNPGRYPTHITGGGVYNSDNINPWGDQTHHPRGAAHLDLNRAETSQTLSKFPPQPAGFPAVASFCQWAAANHIRVLASYPNIVDGPRLRTPAAKQAAGRIAGFFSDLGVPVIGDYTDAILPPGQFFDTVYHLDEEAALARTQRLIEKLRPYLETPSYPRRDQK